MPLSKGEFVTVSNDIPDDGIHSRQFAGKSGFVEDIKDNNFKVRFNTRETAGIDLWYWFEEKYLIK